MFSRYPWLVFSDDKWLNLGRGGAAERPVELRDEIRAVIERHNVADIALYAQGVSMMQQQLEVVLQ